MAMSKKDTEHYDDIFDLIARVALHYISFSKQNKNFLSIELNTSVFSLSLSEMKNSKDMIQNSHNLEKKIQ